MKKKVVIIGGGVSDPFEGLDVVADAIDRNTRENVSDGIHCVFSC